MENTIEKILILFFKEVLRQKGESILIDKSYFEAASLATRLQYVVPNELDYGNRKRLEPSTREEINIAKEKFDKLQIQVEMLKTELKPFSIKEGELPIKPPAIEKSKESKKKKEANKRLLEF